MGSFDYFNIDLWGEKYDEFCFLGNHDILLKKNIWCLFLDPIFTIFKNE
jgi:hypothetical protein